MTYYTPWFPRGGDSAVFAFDVTAMTGNATVDVYAQTKNSETPDGASSPDIVTANTKSCSAGVNEWKPAGTDWDGCLELIRFKIVVGSNDESPSMAHLRALNPSWVTN